MKNEKTFYLIFHITFMVIALVLFLHDKYDESVVFFVLAVSSKLDLLEEKFEEILKQKK